MENASSSVQNTSMAIKYQFEYPKIYCQYQVIQIDSPQLALIEPNIERRKLNRNFSKAIKLTDMLCILFIS